MEQNNKVAARVIGGTGGIITGVEWVREERYHQEERSLN